ncbi:MAG: ABC transporter permease [Clostridia bacterium]
MKFLQFFRTKGVNNVIYPILSILLGMLGAGIIIAFFGVNPFTAYKELVKGSFGSIYGLSATLQRFMPLAFAGLAATLAFRGGIFNIGIEGQLYMGALFSTWVGISFEKLPAIIHIPLALLAGGIAGGIWAFIPGYLKAKKGFNEILVSIFMNFIGVYTLGAALNTFLRAPGQGIPWSSEIVESARLPQLPGSDLSIGIFMIFIFAFTIQYIFKHRTFGYEIKAVGYNKDASIYGGINTTKVIIVTMVLSGFIGSFAGSVEILGMQHRLTENFLVDYGYNAIPVALLGGLNPFGTLVAAFFFAALINGASSMQIALGVPVAIVKVIMALAILGSLGMHGLQKTVESRRKRRDEQL